MPPGARIRGKLCVLGVGQPAAAGVQNWGDINFAQHISRENGVLDVVDSGLGAPLRLCVCIYGAGMHGVTHGGVTLLRNERSQVHAP